MTMAKMSVPQAAERLGVSPARVRQRIDDGSLIAEKVGGRWLLDLEASQPQKAQAGRPVSPLSVWWSLVAFEPDLTVNELMHGVQRLSRSSRDRAVRRVAEAIENRDHDGLLAWLSNRASRHLFVAAASDLKVLRSDSRLVASGLSDPRSGMDDLRVLEGYVKDSELETIASEYWLERPSVDDRPNIVLHASPVRPAAVGPMLLAADLAEHGGPRELLRSRELLDEAIDALVAVDGLGAPG
jgi:excisionase family DNA binding protein